MADSDEDNFVSIGNPLPEIDEDEALPKPVKHQEQTVTDAKGRPQRFHGAFTGGFSAGYFNTVATPQGFEPSTFVSSRTKRAEKNVQHQHPEDFMDDEDMGEHGIAPRKIQTTTKFESQGASAKRQLRQMPREGLLSSAVLANLITPASLPMGVKLLRKMGWKEGQGIGPRQVKRKKKKPGQKEDTGQKIYGCAWPPPKSDGESDASSDEGYQGITFAPKDITAISFKPKDNVHGIGYSGINPHSAFGEGRDHFSLFDQPDVPTLKGKKKGMRGQAFGVGALNNEDDDIYAQDNLSRYSFEINEDEPKDSNYGWTAPRRHTGKPNSSSKVIEGFKLSQNTGFTKKIYPPPRLPKGYRPVHRPKAVVKVIEEETKKDKERHDASSRSEVLGEAPEFRSVFDLVPEADKKRIDVMKPKLPQKINRWDRKEPLPPAATPSSNQKTESLNEPTQVTGNEANTAANQKEDSNKTSQSNRKQNVPLFQPATYSATSGFKPFAKLPEKQLRYEAYLETKKKGIPFETELNATLTEWEKDKELEEFSRAAQLYTRVNNVMSARFTHGQHSDTIDHNETTEKAEIVVDRSDEDKAAQMKMFGKLTREVVEWHPHKNLCKYFNVPNPYPDSSIVGLRTVKRDKYSLFNFLHVPEEPELPSPPPKEPQKALLAPPDKSKPEKKKSIFTEETLAKVNQKISFKIGVDQAQKKTEEDSLSDQTENMKSDGTPAEELQEQKMQEEEQAEEEEAERPPMDLFRAIFSGSESSSESSDDSDDEESNKDAENLPKIATEPAMGIQTSDSNTKDSTVATSSGVPSNTESQETMMETNFDVSKSTIKSDTDQTKNDTTIDSDSVNEASCEDSYRTANSSFGPSLPPDLYGPALPPTSTPIADSFRDETVSSTSKSRKSKHKSDKEKKSSHKDKKRSKHKKEKKKKSKHKKSSSSKHKEKKKYKDQSSSDGSDDSEDSGDNRVDERDLLARLKSFAR